MIPRNMRSKGLNRSFTPSNVVYSYSWAKVKDVLSHDYEALCKAIQ